MNCLVTAGPTYEPLDEVRRLTNFSTGRLGSELAGFLAGQGHGVTLLLGHDAAYRGNPPAQVIETFTTTPDLYDRLNRLSKQPFDAVLHAAAVNDFGFGRIWERTTEGQLVEVHAHKLPTRQGALLAELVPTPKVIAVLREWFPLAKLIGWKYELDGSRAEALAKAAAQMATCRTNACVLNGRAYGTGYGLVTGQAQCQHFEDDIALFRALAALIES